VLSARLLGRSSHVRVRCDCQNSAETPVLQARVPGVFGAAEGSAVAVALDPDQVFIFPDA
jgi:iron(III) transport system ATP-binding protein